MNHLFILEKTRKHYFNQLNVSIMRVGNLKHFTISESALSHLLTNIPGC